MTGRNWEMDNNLQFNRALNPSPNTNFTAFLDSVGPNYYDNPKLKADRTKAGVDANRTWVYNYRTLTHQFALEGIVNLGNLLFHRERTRWNIYALFGGGGLFYNCKYDALDKNVTREIPKLVASDNHLATGSIVGKSNAFSEWIQKNNRKASAMEMETASVFDSANTRIENCRKLAIRGVSDFADSRKSLVEKNYKSKFREISMTNAVEFFVMLINADIFPRADRTTGSISTDSENKMLREKQLKEHISKDLALLNDYEDLIRLEEEPRRIAKYQREIDRLNFSISKYKNELHDLKS